MSADNGVYILKTEKQYRVKHLSAINTLYWNNKDAYCDDMQPQQIINMFGDCKYTYSCEQAFNIALKIQSTLSVCEFGIVLLDAQKSWEKIVDESKVNLIVNTKSSQNKIKNKNMRRSSKC